MTRQDEVRRRKEIQLHKTAARRISSTPGAENPRDGSAFAAATGPTGNVALSGCR